MTVSIIGIDPGNEGALAGLSHAGDVVDMKDMPCIADGTRGRRTINAALVAAIVRRWAPTAAYIELIGPRPTDAKVAAFSFGRCRGCLEGIFGAMGIPVTMLTVPTWRRAVGLPAGATKGMARGEAIRRWPAKAELFARAKDHGRAEAALIAIAGLLRESRR
jgi:crossover junction endodeoxyribonuclease RuvC